MNQTDYFDSLFKKKIHKRGSAKAIILSCWAPYTTGTVIIKSAFIKQCVEIKTFDVENFGRRIRELREDPSEDFDYKSLGNGRIRKV